MTPLLLALAVVVGASQADPAVCIDPGHGGADPGAVGNGLYEDQLNLEAGLAFRDWLDLDSSDAGGGGRWEVHMTRETDVEVSLSSRCDYANSLGVDWFMSIHANAGGGDGTETYAYASGTTADSLAQDVQDEVLDHLGTRDRGVKYESFYVLVYTSMPADLNEMAFIDTWAGNAELLSDPANLDEVGLAHLHAIQQQNGISAYTPSEDTDPGEPTGRVSLEDFPRQLEPGAAFEVTVGYQTDLHAFGERGQLGLRMADAGSWATLDEQVWDNGGVGIQGPEGDYTFQLEAPDDVEEVIFVAWLSPLGAGWDDRYDDANSSSTPTSIDDDDEPVDTGEPPVEGEIELSAVPAFVVLGQPFELRVRYGEGVSDQVDRLGVELIELQRGLVVETQVLDLVPGETGSGAFDFTYEGQAEQIWFHTCAFESGQSMTAATCLSEDSSEDTPTRVMQGRERFTDGGCACSSPGRVARSWVLLILALVGLAARRRSV
jgi:N-acetylmuramoyl-L-alanine amidase